MQRKLVFLVSLLMFSSSCTLIDKQSVSVYYKFNEIEGTEFSQVVIKIFHGKSLIETDSAVCKVLTLTLRDVQSDLVNYPVKTDMWLPQDTLHSINKLCMLIPPALGNTTIMYPIAIKLIKKNIPVVFLSYHGVKNDLMENLDIAYGLRETNDGIIVLEGAKKILKTDSLDVVVYGVSLGGVIALNLAGNYPEIKALVLEGIPYDLNKASKIAFGKTIVEIISKEDLKKIENFTLPTLIKKINPKTSILALWSLSDKFVSKDEIDSLIFLFKEKLNRFDYYLINKKAHHFRFVYPLTRVEYDSLNNLIVDFILKLSTK